MRIYLLFLLLVGCSSSGLLFQGKSDDHLGTTVSWVKTDGVYVCTFKFDGDNYYSLMRFYDDGRYYNGGVRKGTPSKEELVEKNHSPELLSQYRVVDRKLETESWGGGYAGTVVYYGEKTEDGFLLKYSKSKGLFSTYKEPVNRAYRFQKDLE